MECAKEMHVAVVDDDEDNVVLTCLFLQDEFKITGFSSGADFLQAALDQHFDLILLDLSMPGMDGFSVLQQIRSSETTSGKVVAFTAHGSRRDRDKALEAGFDAFLTKPVLDWQEFLGILKNMASVAI
jgi:CheY-like chemotaxis protein